MKIIIVSLIFVVLLAVSATAEFLDVNQPVHDDIWGGPIGEKQMQSFTTGPTTQFITAFEWKNWNPGGTSDTVKVDLRNYVLDEYGMDSGALLGTKEATFVGATDGDWLRVRFDSLIAVSPGTQYSIFITNIAGYAGYYRSTDAGSYPGGFNARVDNPGTGHWGIHGDLAFRIYSSLESTKAHTPDPTDKEVSVSLGTDLDWEPGVDVVTHKVYFDSSETNVADRLVAPVIINEPDSNCMPPITLQLGETYYWAVDEVNATNVTYPGEVWEFTAEAGDAEKSIPYLIGDLNRDYKVNFKDVGIFASQYLEDISPDAFLSAELDNEGFVDGKDYTLMASNYSQSDIPLGFKVLGTIVPPVYDPPPLYGFTEQTPSDIYSGYLRPTPAQLAKGYVTYTRHYIEKIHPGATPAGSDVTDQLTAFSAPGEYEPVTFSIFTFPGENLTDVSVSVSDLTGPAGSIIESKNIDVRSVRCWPRIVSGQSKYEMIPWFLEKRDLLNIAEEASKRYWITVWVHADATAGTYNGTVTVDVASHDNSTLSLALEVPDIQLMTPPTQHGMYYHIINNQLYTGAGDYYPDEYYYQEVMNMKEHGMKTVWIFNPVFDGYINGGGDVVYNLDPIAPFVDDCHLAGFDPLIWNMTIGSIISGPGSFGECIRGFMDSYLARGWIQPILSHHDEADARGPGNILACQNYLAASKQYVPEAKTYTTIVWPANSELFEPDLDIRTFSSWTDSTVIAPTRAAGRELWMYTGADRGTEINRLNRGFFAAKMTLDGLLDWVYFGYPPVLDNPFDNLAAGNVRGSVLPGLGGPLPTRSWEGTREGVEDEKYVFTLEQLIAQANASGDPGAITLAASAQTYLDSLYAQIWIDPIGGQFPVSYASTLLDVDFYDNARVGMAGHIEAISNAIALLP